MRHQTNKEHVLANRYKRWSSATDNVLESKREQNVEEGQTVTANHQEQTDLVPEMVPRSVAKSLKRGTW